MCTLEMYVNTNTSTIRRMGTFSRCTFRKRNRIRLTAQKSVVFYGIRSLLWKFQRLRNTHSTNSRFWDRYLSIQLVPHIQTNWWHARLPGKGYRVVRYHGKLWVSLCMVSGCTLWVGRLVSLCWAGHSHGCRVKCVSRRNLRVLSYFKTTG